MKKFKMLTVSTILLAVTALAIPAGLQAQEDKKD